MNIAIIGSRTFRNKELFQTSLENVLNTEFNGAIPSKIISGGACGTDTLAANWAKENRIPLCEFLPDYQKYKQAAPLVRNRLIVQNADFIVAFWDNQSRGTKYVITYAQERKKPIKVISI